MRAELDMCGMILNEFRVHMRDDKYKDELKNITADEQFRCYMDIYHERRSRIEKCINECREPCEEIR